MLRDIVKEMREEPRWASEIRDDLEVLGLEKFAELVGSHQGAHPLRPVRALGGAAGVQSTHEAAVRRTWHRDPISAPATRHGAAGEPRRRRARGDSKGAGEMSSPSIEALAAGIARDGFAHVHAPRDARAARRARRHRRLGRLCRELGRSRPRHLHGGWRALPEAAATRAFAARAEGDPRKPHQPHYQSRDYNPLNGGIERWFEPVPRDRRRTRAARDPGDLPRAVRPADAAGVRRLAHRDASVPHRGAGRARTAGRPRKACTATASTGCWCCWSAAVTSPSGETSIGDLAMRAARQLHLDRAAGCRGDDETGCITG